MAAAPITVGVLAILFAFIPGVQFTSRRYSKRISKVEGRLWFVGFGLLFILVGIFGKFSS
jgi:NhaP-type Na+/H+ or K+/H+ antiporter